MSSLNRVTLIGNLGQDPEMKSTTSGKRLCTFTVATSEKWRDKHSGEQKEQTEWHRIVVFNENLAEIAEKYLHKGSKILVEGKMCTRKWTAQDGTDRYSTEVVLQNYDGKIIMLGDKPGNKPERGRPSDDDSFDDAPAVPAPARRPTREDIDDDIPF